MSKLKPCPFCGRTDTLTIIDPRFDHNSDCDCNEYDNGFRAVVCNAEAPGGPGGCGAMGGYGKNEADGVAKWNQRKRTP